MSNMFHESNSISSLPDTSKWDASNVTNMSHMFYYCKELSSLTDISKWDTSKVTNMSFMFSNCAKSLYIPSKFKS